MQFTLRQLFGTLTILSIVLGAFVGFGGYALLIMPFVIVGQAWVVGKLKSKHAANIGFGLLVGEPLLIVALMVPTQQSLGQSKPMICRSQLGFINTALEIYKSEHGEYPPPIEYDWKGRSMHCWRTHIAQCLDYEQLNAAYDWKQPWDGLHNRHLGGTKFYSMPSPYNPDPKPGETSYLAIVVPGAKRGARFAVIEVPCSGVNFLEPRELRLTELLDPIHGSARIAKLPAPGIPFVHVLWPDGEIERVEIDGLQERLRELLPKAR